MKGRFIVIVLDSLGVGFMEDVPLVRPQDQGANTCLHVLQSLPQLHLPHLRKLGLMNAVGMECGAMTFSTNVVYGVSNLMHEGGDTFLGHQEIMGTRPRQPFIEPFSHKIAVVSEALERHGYRYRHVGKTVSSIVVNDAVIIGDNLETDPGCVYNVSGCLDVIPFETVLDIGRVVREVCSVSRVVALGGEGVSLDELLHAHQEVNGTYAGIDTPASGLYRRGYQVVHLGYGVDAEVQVPALLAKSGVHVSLIGKVADIVDNRGGTSIHGVDTDWLFGQLIAEMDRHSSGFLCLNIQETDLAGHAQDVVRYGDRLQVSDRYIGQIIEHMGVEDILIVMADHGNDPTIGHSQHTREKVPLLIYRSGMCHSYLGLRETMSDVGATVLDYFGAEKCENGESFLSFIR